MYVTMLIASVIIFGTVCVIFWRSPAFNWYHPLTVYLAFHGLVFVLRPWLSYLYGYRKIYLTYQFWPSVAEKVTTLNVTNLGLICFASAALYFGDAPFRFKRDVFEEKRKTHLMKPFLIMVAILSPLALYSVYTIWQNRLGNADYLELDLKSGTTIMKGSNGYILQLQTVLAPLSILYAWLNRFKLYSLIPLLIFIFLRGGTGGRGPIVFALFGLACFFLYERQRRWLNVRVLMLAIVGVMAFNFVGADRGRTIRNLVVEDQTEAYQSTEKLAPLEGMDLGNLEFLEYLVYAVPERTGTYEYFVDQLQILTEPIPRQLWAGKPVGQPIRLFNLFDYGFPIGMTRSLPGEGWTQLGYVGVAFWCALWGAILGKIYNLYVRSRQSVFQTATYMCFLPLLILFYRDGYPITLLRFGLFLFAPILLWYWIARYYRVPTADEFRLISQVRAMRRRGSSEPKPGEAKPASPASRGRRRRREPYPPPSKA